MNTESRIYVAGHRGWPRSARRPRTESCPNLTLRTLGDAGTDRMVGCPGRPASANIAPADAALDIHRRVAADLAERAA